MAYYKCGSIHPTQNSNVVVDTASGAIANFQTPLAMPLLKTRFDFKATQEAGTPTPDSPKAISGVSTVSVFHCHKNLYQYDASKVTTGETYAGTTRSYLPLGLKGACTLTFSASLKDGQQPTVQYINIGKMVNGIITPLQALIQASTIFTRTINFNAGDEIVLVSASEQLYAITDSLPRYNIQIEVGSNASELEPYNGSTTIINLGGTYYGGYVTQDKDGKRELVVTHKVFDIGSSTWNGTTDGYTQNKEDITDMKTSPSGSTKANFICSSYKTATPSNVYNKVENSTIAIATNQRLRVYDTRLTGMTGQQVQDALTGVYIAYEMVTPITIALPDGEPIKSLPGVNNIFADTGDTSLQFRKIG